MISNDWPRVMIDPLLEAVFLLDGDASAAEAAMVMLYNTPENMWPPLDPLPKVFEGSPWKSRNDIRNHMHVIGDKVMPYRATFRGDAYYEVQHYESFSDRTNVLCLLMQMMQYAPNRSEYHGGPTAAGQIAHAFGRLMAHLPASMVDEAIAIYQMNPRPKARRP